MKHWILLLLACFVVSPMDARSKRHQPTTSTRDRAVNQTLDTVLEVGSEWRGQHRSFTWGELEREVARRLRVIRKEP